MLDTNVISELTKPKPAPAVMAWAERQPVETMYATSIGEAELIYGIALLRHGRRRQELHHSVRTVFLNLLTGRVLPFDSAAAAA